ncbi:juvenile hormone esterase-like [Cylas formicarius]|uniref:juvenile hormone esterase-like n=1 Tax=Cylas formicarius TaxID=197179 RepID=UPI0029586F10|nr:juvenile hormone esterase-like [Cylas formicarius]
MRRVIVIATAITLVASEAPIVEIRNGKVLGTVVNTFTKGEFYAFQGIPYAQPPVGRLRFQAPQPASDWEGIIDDSKKDNICFQVKSDSDNENEDCLYINVFTPTYSINNSSSRLPIVFYIYGGGFRAGSAGLGSIGPDHFIENDVIVVTHNYRIGPFGFLSTGDIVLPGNAGLKDQSLALKWTFDNIEFFGGDPNKITIMGESAGSASVGYQILSSKNKGLFRGAIAESGSPLNEWASIMNPLDYIFALLDAIDPEIQISKDSESMLAYLQSIEARQIDQASTMTEIKLTLPVVEIEHEGAFITQGMYEAFEQGNYNKVPLILGVNSEEEIIMLQSTKAVKVQGRAYDADLDILIPENFKTRNEVGRSVIAEDIKEIYMERDNNFGDFMNSTIRYMSDNGFTRGVIRQGELMSQYSDVYFYVFSYDGELGGWDLSEEGAEKVGHGEELKYLWVHRGTHSTQDLSQFPDSDVVTLKRMVKMWTDFSKTLNPTPEISELLENVTWPRVRYDNYQYLDIGEELKAKTNPKTSYLKWSAIYDKYAKRPYVTF